MHGHHHLRHHQTSLMQKEYISNRKGSHRLSGPRAKPHQNSAGQKAPVARRDRGPDGTHKIKSITDDVNWPPSILIDERHPDQVTSPLHESGGREEVRSFVDGGPESAGSRLGTRKELHGCLNNGNRWASSKEIADHHSEANDEG
jgi:hypothetical protein